MDFTTKAFLVTQFVLAATICAAQTTNTSSNYSYDITKTLSNCIKNLFFHTEPEQVNKFLNKIKNYDHRKFEFYTAHMFNKTPFNNKIFFNGINITGSRDVMNFHRPHIHCQFPDGKINFSITVTRIPMSCNQPNKFSVVCTYEKSSSFDLRPTFVESLTSNRKKELEDQFKKALTSLLLDNIKNQHQFLHALDENFLSQPEKDINLAHPRFSQHRQQHYFFIPNVFFYWFNLRNVSIGGLWNFHSLKANEMLTNSTNTLLVKNIRGSMTLDYGCEIEKPLELNFIADSIYISADFNTNQSNVEARDYHVIRTAINTPVTNRQATVIMQQIELAIASLVLPWTTPQKNSNQSSCIYDMENPLEKMFADTAKKPDTKSIKQLFSKWIPFDQS